MKFKVVETELKYQGKAFSVRRDQVQLPDGRTTVWDVVVHSGAVTVVPVDDSGMVWFVRQYRHAIGAELLELPAGTLESGEDPLVCALREVREETGMAAADMLKVGDFFLAPGYSTEFMHVYLATGLTEDPLQQDDDEFLSVEKIPLVDALKMAENGGFKDAKTLAALLLVRARVIGSQ